MLTVDPALALACSCDVLLLGAQHMTTPFPTAGVHGQDQDQPCSGTWSSECRRIPTSGTFPRADRTNLSNGGGSALPVSHQTTPAAAATLGLEPVDQAQTKHGAADFPPGGRLWASQHTPLPAITCRHQVAAPWQRCTTTRASRPSRNSRPGRHWCPLGGLGLSTISTTSLGRGQRCDRVTCW